MAEIVRNPIADIWERFRTEVLELELVPEKQLSFGNADANSVMPWIAFKPMTNYTWLQARDLSNNEGGIIVNLQIECFAKTESRAMEMEDACKQILFNMGFYANGFAQRFHNNQVYRYIARYALNYTGELHILNDN